MSCSHSEFTSAGIAQTMQAAHADTVTLRAATLRHAMDQQSCEVLGKTLFGSKGRSVTVSCVCAGACVSTRSGGQANLGADVC